MAKEEKNDDNNELLTLSPTSKRFTQKVLDIFLQPETPADQKAFLARQLVQATLPHSDPGDIQVWKRVNGNLTLIIQPGYDAKNNKMWGYPYGTIPRLLLFWLTTEVSRTESRRVELGKSMAEFMRKLGLDHSKGGKRSDGARLREQMMRLFHARISFQQTTTKGTITNENWLNMDVTQKGQMWWDLEKSEDALVGSWIDLGEDFYNALVAAPVPADLRALEALKNSSLSLDLYIWATYRTKTVTDKGEGQFIQWESFMQQFGSEYAHLDNFVRKAKQAFNKIRKVYPALNIKYKKGGFYILPGAPAVAELVKNPIITNLK